MGHPPDHAGGLAAAPGLMRSEAKLVLISPPVSICRPRRASYRYGRTPGRSSEIGSRPVHSKETCHGPPRRPRRDPFRRPRRDPHSSSPTCSAGRSPPRAPSPATPSSTPASRAAPTSRSAHGRAPRTRCCSSSPSRTWRRRWPRPNASAARIVQPAQQVPGTSFGVFADAQGHRIGVAANG